MLLVNCFLSKYSYLYIKKRHVHIVQLQEWELDSLDFLLTYTATNYLIVTPGQASTP